MKAREAMNCTREGNIKYTGAWGPLPLWKTAAKTGISSPMPRSWCRKAWRAGWPTRGWWKIRCSKCWGACGPVWDTVAPLMSRRCRRTGSLSGFPPLLCGKAIPTTSILRRKRLIIALTNRKRYILHPPCFTWRNFYGIIFLIGYYVPICGRQKGK